ATIVAHREDTHPCPVSLLRGILATEKSDRAREDSKAVAFERESVSVEARAYILGERSVEGRVVRM
ncbi:hypothetical protein HDU98_004716, partial [Podochytrium sp. JEL0797]